MSAVGKAYIATASYFWQPHIQAALFTFLISHIINWFLHLAGAFYMRLVGKPMEVYQYLEPLYNDYRKVGREQDWFGELLNHD